MGDGIVAGSSQYKEAIKQCSFQIEFFEDGRLRDSTIGVVVVSRPGHWCYVIAPSTKFTNNMKRNPPFLVKVRLRNHSKCIIQDQDLKITVDIAMFYLYGQDVQANEMEIAHVLPARNETIYLFSYNDYVKGEILHPGNVTLAGEDYLTHDCPSPDPVKTRNEATRTSGGIPVEITVTPSGEILLNDVGMLVGIVSETDRSTESDPTDRTIAINATAIRGQVLNNNETIAQFKERINNNANPPTPVYSLC